MNKIQAKTRQKSGQPKPLKDKNADKAGFLPAIGGAKKLTYQDKYQMIKNNREKEKRTYQTTTHKAKVELRPPSMLSMFD